MIYWGIQTGLFEDIEGIKVFFILKACKHHFDKRITLKRKQRVFAKGPELPDPAMLAEVSVGKPIEPEDIISGNIELEKPLEPEDIGGDRDES